MSALGSRLREERARLGLSQAAFGAAGGVRTRAQFNYEAGNRFPDARYLSAISARGADIHYILTGRRLPGAASAFRPADTPLVSCDRRARAIAPGFGGRAVAPLRAGWRRLERLNARIEASPASDVVAAGIASLTVIAIIIIAGALG